MMRCNNLARECWEKIEEEEGRAVGKARLL